jgi:ATP-dependent DNA ligase
MTIKERDLRLRNDGAIARPSSGSHLERLEESLGTYAGFIAPMRPKMVPSLPDDRSKWLLEPKLDGYRVIAVKSGGHASSLLPVESCPL